MDGSEWFAPEIGKAVAAGYMNGYPDFFQACANIARQEAAVALARIAGLKDSGGSGSAAEAVQTTINPRMSKSSLSR